MTDEIFAGVWATSPPRPSPWLRLMHDDDPEVNSARPETGGEEGGEQRMMTTKTLQKHTGNDLWSLEVLIRMNVAGRNSKVESHC